jgi:hypothetical protein
VLDGQDMSIVQDWDIPNIATITGTTIITMQPGQKVSDSLFFLLHETNKNTLFN